MIKIIKLVNNHEIIGSVISESSDYVVLDQPFSIHYMMSTRVQHPSIGLFRYMPFAKSREMSFSTRDIINNVEARESMTGYYRTVLDNYVNYVDDNIDNELTQVAVEESSNEQESEMTSAELMVSILSKFNNGKIH